MISDLFKFGLGGVGLLLGILGAIGLYKTFTKAEKPGIVAFIPILNLMNMIHIAGKPMWWIFLFLIPGVNAVIMVLVLIGIAKRFDKGWLFGLGLFALAPIFWMILGFGDATYHRPALR
jgi:hypothetical protein